MHPFKPVDRAWREICASSVRRRGRLWAHSQSRGMCFTWLVFPFLLSPLPISRPSLALERLTCKGRHHTDSLALLVLLSTLFIYNHVLHARFRWLLQLCVSWARREGRGMGGPKGRRARLRCMPSLCVHGFFGDQSKRCLHRNGSTKKEASYHVAVTRAAFKYWGMAAWVREANQPPGTKMPATWRASYFSIGRQHGQQLHPFFVAGTSEPTRDCP